jgi:predicted PurR-regulated permease PerM
VASTTRAQHLTAPAVRGRVIGALLAVNAVGLSVGAGLAALPLPTPALMWGLTALLLGLLPLWPAALRRHERTQRLSASSSACVKASSSSSQG